jgi:hypothetical protein
VGRPVPPVRGGPVVNHFTDEEYDALLEEHAAVVTEARLEREREADLRDESFPWPSEEEMEELHRREGGA